MRSCLLLLSLLLTGNVLYAQMPDTNLWVPNGVVYATLKKGNNLYIGGKFNDVGPCTGNAAVVDSASGLLVRIPQVDGKVNAVVADSAGGCYIGGLFDFVGQQYFPNLVHIKPDGSIDNNFQPHPNGEVFTLSLMMKDSILAVGGSFSEICDSTRQHAASIRTDSSMITQWNPAPNGNVYALTESQGWIFVGGSFTFIGGQSRNNIGKTNATNGIVVATNQPNPWNVNVNNTVRAITIKGNTVFIGGNFTGVGASNTVTRTYIAAIDEFTGILKPWNVTVGGPVRTIQLAGNVLYMGGEFALVTATSRPHAAALDINTGALLSWSPAPNGDVYSIYRSGPQLYIGGDFTTICGQPRKKIACVDTAGTLLGWDPHASDLVRSVFQKAGKVYAGGDFVSMNGVDRDNLAKLDLTTGMANFWNPGANNVVMCLDTSGSTLYIGGSFTTVSNQTRNRIAAIDLTSGGVTSWDPNINGTVRTFYMDSNILYAGGLFSSVGPQARNSLASISLASGLATPWNPNVNGTVNDIIRTGNKTYIGGYFSSVSAQPHSYLAELDTIAVSPLTPWAPAPDAGIYSMVESAGILYTGGWFTSMDGQSRTSLAAVEVSTASATSWNASTNANGNVRSLFMMNDTLYAGGDFTDIDGLTRYNIARMDLLTASIHPWTMNCSNTVHHVNAYAGHVIAGGTFRRVAGYFHPYLVVADNSQTVGITEHHEKENLLSIYPNPCTDKLNIAFESSKPLQLNIYTMMGQQVMSTMFTGGNIDVSRLDAGIYFIELITTEGVRSARMVKL